MVRGEREPENDHSQSDAPMAADGDNHADDGDDECDQLNRTYDREPDAYREFNDHNRTTGQSQNARYVMQINSRSIRCRHTHQYRPTVPSHHNGR